MIKTFFEIVIDGYGPQETDFVARLGGTDPQVQKDFENGIIQSLVDVVASVDQTATLLVQGHADRVDTAGLSREERRQQELDASSARAKSADLGTFQILASRFREGFPGDWAKLSQVALLNRVAGAAFLVESAEALTEEQRRANRRVILTLVRFQPD